MCTRTLPTRQVRKHENHAPFPLVPPLAQTALGRSGGLRHDAMSTGCAGREKGAAFLEILSFV